MTSKSTQPPRLVANPCVSVADLVKTFKSWLDMSLSKDLFALLAPPGNTAFTWKTGPNHLWLARVAPLFVQLTRVAPNTVLTSKKVLLVISSLRGSGSVINTTKMTDQTFDDWCDQTVRILFAKYREIKKDKASLERVMKRCTQVEAKAIQEVLKLITISTGDAQPEEQTSNITLSPPKTWGDWGPISSSGIGSMDSESKSSQAPKPKDPDSWCTTDLSIFQKVLQNNNEANSQDTKIHQQVHQKPNSTNSNFPISSPPAKKSKCKHTSPNWKMTLNTPPEATLTDSDCNEGFDDEEQRMIQTSLKTKIHNNKAKKPKAKAKSSSSSNNATTTSPKASKDDKSKKGIKSHLEKPKLADEKPSQKLLLKRCTSAAYHKALKLALADGKDEEAAKEEARVAYKKAAEEFNAGL